MSSNGKPKGVKLVGEMTINGPFDAVKMADLRKQLEAVDPEKLKHIRGEPPLTKREQNNSGPKANNQKPSALPKERKAELAEKHAVATPGNKPDLKTDDRKTAKVRELSGHKFAKATIVERPDYPGSKHLTLTYAGQAFLIPADKDLVNWMIAKLGSFSLELSGEKGIGGEPKLVKYPIRGPVE